MKRIAFTMPALTALQRGCRQIDSPVAALKADGGLRRFVDVREAMGLDFDRDAGPVGDSLIPHQVGSATVLFDFNNDSGMHPHHRTHPGRFAARGGQNLSKPAA